MAQENPHRLQNRLQSIDDSHKPRTDNVVNDDEVPFTTRYPCRIPIRMTHAERATIGKKANTLNKSISRYLVEAGVHDKLGQAISDPARLRYLQILFQDAADKAKSLLASPLFIPKNELTSDVKARLEEAAYLLKALSGELTRRLL